MRTRVVFLSAAVLLLASAVVFALSLRQQATASVPSIPSANSSQASESVSPSAGDNLQMDDAAADSLDVDAVQQLIGNWTSGLLSTQGWLHVKEQVTQQGLDLGELPDGSPVPSDYVMDSWYFLDQDGMAIAAAAVMSDPSGKEQQVSVYEGGTWTNLTFGFDAAGEPFAPNLDQGVADDLESVGSGIAGFDLQDAVVSGRPSVVVTTYEDFAAPISLAGFSAEVRRIEKRAVLDRETGALLTYDTFFTAESGQVTHVSGVQVLVAEAVGNPPERITSLFKDLPK